MGEVCRGARKQDDDDHVIAVECVSVGSALRVFAPAQGRAMKALPTDWLPESSTTPSVSTMTSTL